MKVKVSILFLIVLNLSLKSQIPEEAFILTNSLSGLWLKADLKEAVESSLKLYKLYPPFLFDRIHMSLSQVILDKDTRKDASKFLNELYNQNNEGINKNLKPIYIWSKVLLSSDSSELNQLLNETKLMLADTSNHISMAERYGLLIINELQNRKSIDFTRCEDLLLKIIHNLEVYPYIEKEVNGRRNSEIRAWNRFLLAYSYYVLYKNFNSKEEYLVKASGYSPDVSDWQVKYAYFYDLVLLTGNENKAGYKTEYMQYLKDHQRYNEALKLLTEIAFTEPTDLNLKNLKTYLNEVKPDSSFSVYWNNYINSKATDVPKIVIEYPLESVNLNQKPGYWIYIDVWGSWCKPCVNELPDLQSFYVKNSSLRNNDLKIITLSYNSKDLSNFMTENKYTFPVSEIDNKIKDLFLITGFPTKILITPEGKYLKIPFGADWKMYIRNYSHPF